MHLHGSFSRLAVTCCCERNGPGWRANIAQHLTINNVSCESNPVGLPIKHVLLLKNQNQKTLVNSNVANVMLVMDPSVIAIIYRF